MDRDDMDDDDRRERRRGSYDDDDDGRRDGRGREYTNRRDDDGDVETITCDSNDAAFILGKGGSTKHKIARVCGADIELNERENSISIRGAPRQRQQAKDYIGFVMQQRTGSVEIDLDAGRDDMTVVRVPMDCVAFVMGRGGQTLRSMEGEWGTLMFFAKGINGDPEDNDRELLMIFGALRARRGAEMKVMSAVEHKVPQTFVRDGELVMQRRVRGDEAPEGWSVDTMELAGDEFSYALGAGGSTRKKLAAASGCVLEYVGRLACMSGYKPERKRAKDYLQWLLRQRQGSVKVDVEDRDDVVAVPIPAQSVGFITGHRGEALRAVEKESSTFCFVNEGERGSAEDLLIFSIEPRNRKVAKRMILDKLDEHKHLSRGGGPGGYRRDEYRRDDRDDYRRRDRDDYRQQDYNRRDHQDYDRRDRDYDRRRDDRDDRDRDYNRRDRQRDYDKDDDYDRRGRDRDREDDRDRDRRRDRDDYRRDDRDDYRRRDRD